MQDYPFTTGTKGGFSSVFWYETEEGIEFEGILKERKIGNVTVPSSKTTICTVYITPICGSTQEKCFVVDDPFKYPPIKVYHYFNDVLDDFQNYFGVHPVQAPDNQSLFA